MTYTSTYIQKQLIGRGHYGRVYKAIHNTTKKPFVAKKIDLQGMTPEQQQKALKEVQIHKNLKHKNILEFKEYFLQNDVLIMIMQHCEFGDLSVYIKQRKQTGQLFDQPLIINLFVQMLFGLNYLHEHKVLHRDIKAQNIFIDSQGTVKLADFGISKMLEHTQGLASTIVGTPYYLSPQACKNQGYSFKSDVWSLGCVLYELATLEYPFNGDNILLLAKKISTEEPKEISGGYSLDLAKLIKWMLRKDPQQRPTIRQVLESRFVSDYLVRFKMHDQVIGEEIEGYNQQQQQYPIFQTTSNLSHHFEQGHSQENEFMSQSFYNSNNNYNPTKPLQSPTKSPHLDEIKISPQKSRSQNLKQKCIQKMGPQLFAEIYSFMKSSQQRNVKESQVQEYLRGKYSKKEVQMSMDVAQLVYLEEGERK